MLETPAAPEKSIASTALCVWGILSLILGTAALAKAFAVAGRIMYGQMLTGYAGGSPPQVQLELFLAVGATLYLGGAIVLVAGCRARG